MYSNGLYTNLTTQMDTKRWYHVAYTRESGTHKWYVDGVLRGSDSTARDYTDDKLTIGANSYAESEPLDGFISNDSSNQRNCTLHIKLHTTSSTTDKCNQYKTSVLSVKYFCRFCCCFTKYKWIK